MNEKMKNLAAALGLLAVALCGIVIFLLLRAGGTGGRIAVISVDGVELRRIDLGAVGEPYDIPVTTDWGSNVIHVEKGAISVTQSDCPDHICMQMGKLRTGGGLPIICMPHRLVIELEGTDVYA
jgi:hypothetical protein